MRQGVTKSCVIFICSRGGSLSVGTSGLMVSPQVVAGQGPDHVHVHAAHNREAWKPQTKLLKQEK